MSPRRTIIAVASFLVLTGSVQAQEAEPKVIASPGGRYAFGQVNSVRADQFLLDTETGKMWRILTITDDSGERLYWGLEPIVRRDESDVLDNAIGTREMRTRAVVRQGLVAVRNASAGLHRLVQSTEYDYDEAIREIQLLNGNIGAGRRAEIVENVVALLQTSRDTVERANTSLEAAKDTLRELE